MKKVLLVQPSLQPPGGANGVAAWIIEALKQEHAVSVLTWTPVEPAPINRYYGTSLRASEFTAYGVHPIVRWLIDRVPGPIGKLKTAILLRLCKKMKDEYNVIITANYEADFGRKGIQYVNFPRAYQSRPDIDVRWNLFSPALLNAYYHLCQRISEFSVDRMKQNLTLVVSDWTGTKVRERHGIEATTLYPPVPGIFPEVAWEHRENGFIAIGRIAPEKELEKMIDSLAAVRSQGWDIHLHIIGSPEDSRYYEQILQRVHENASWIFLEENLSREELVDLVSRHRYGIHGMAEEHFGIAVAELVRGGCLVFVPRGGGQVEIIGADERLLYSTPEEAVAKIVRTISDPDVQRSLSTHLASRKGLFSTDHFMRRIQELVRHFGET
ncbi:MAG TPA: glycosyltransferase [Candidatus Methylomirabilis sp.]|nr:glycosyltransferase [Candidatus Methylomirabilis sp.]